MTAPAKQARSAGGSEAEPGTWSWVKLWSGYVVTVLPYLSAALVLIPGILLSLKFIILALFGIFVISVRIVHEKAGVEVTGTRQKQKRPGDGR